MNLHHEGTTFIHLVSSFTIENFHIAIENKFATSRIFRVRVMGPGGERKVAAWWGDVVIDLVKSLVESDSWRLTYLEDRKTNLQQPKAFRHLNL
jgi:hypothetical protein